MIVPNELIVPIYKDNWGYTVNFIPLNAYRRKAFNMFNIHKYMNRHMTVLSWEIRHALKIFMDKAYKNFAHDINLERLLSYGSLIGGSA